MFRYITFLLIGSFLLFSCDTKLIDLRVKSQNGAVLECDPAIYGDACNNSDDLILVKKDELNADNIKNGQTIGGVEGKVIAECSEDGEIGCVASTEYKAIDINNHKSKIISSESILGVSGNFVIPDSESILQSFSYGSEGKLSGTIPYCSNNGSGCYLSSYSEGVEGYQLKALDYDDIDSKKSNIQNGVEIVSGITGTQMACSSGGNNCYIDENFKAVETEKLIASNIKHDLSLGGVTGSYYGSYVSCSESVHTGCLTTESYPAVPATITSSLLSSATVNGTPGSIENCNAGESSCYINSNSFKAAESSLLLASNIKKDAVIGEVTGNYPSTLYPLSNSTDTLDLVTGNLNKLMRSTTGFEWFDSFGNRYSGVGDSDIVANNIKDGVEIFGVNGNYRGLSPRVFTTNQAFAVLNTNGSVSTGGDGWAGGTAPGGVLTSGVKEIYSTNRAFAAIKEGGEVVAWGDSFYGGNDPSPPSPNGGSLSSEVVSIYSNSSAFAAVKEGGSVVTWGGSGGNFNYSDGSTTAAPEGSLSSGVEKIYPTDHVFIALKSNGKVITWGRSNIGGNSSNPTGGDLSSGVEDIYFTKNESAFAALKSDGSVVTWGSESSGGNFNYFDGSTTATPNGSLSSGVIDICSAGGAFAALKSDGSVVSWGISGSGGNSSNPTGGDLSSGVVSIYSTSGAFAAIKEGGSVVTWGEDYSNAGNFNYSDGSTTAAPNGSLSSGVVSIYSSGGAFAALKNNGSLVTWGQTSSGGDSSLCVGGNLSSGVKKIYSNGNAFVALKYDGSIVNWGSSSNGGNFTYSDGSTTAAPYASLYSGVKKIYYNSGAFAALKDDGTVITWGQNSYGGNSSSTYILDYTWSPFLTDIIDIKAGTNFFIGIRKDGSYVSWGRYQE